MQFSLLLTKKLVKRYIWSTYFYGAELGHFGKTIIYIFFLWRCGPTRGMASKFLMFLDHIRHATVGRTPLDEWSARRRDLYLTTHNTHNRQTYMPPAGFEPSIFRTAAADLRLWPRGLWHLLIINRRTFAVIKCGAAEGSRRSLLPIAWKIN